MLILDASTVILKINMAVNKTFKARATWLFSNKH